LGSSAAGGWKEDDSYQKSFDRLMRDLRVKTAEQ